MTVSVWLTNSSTNKESTQQMSPFSAAYIIKIWLVGGFRCRLFFNIISGPSNFLSKKKSIFFFTLQPLIYAFN